MSEQQKQRNSGKIIEAIIEKLLPWHRIKWLSVGQLSQTVRIRVVGMNVAVGLCPDESLFQVQFLEPATSPEDLHQIQRLEAILNGAKRDDAGNLTSMVCGVDKGIEKPSCSVSAVVPLLPDPGEGYRLLDKDKSEELKPGDEYWSAEDGKWEPSLRAIYGLTIKSGSDVYRRKIEPANPSETPNISTWIPKVGDKVRVARGFMNPVGKVGIIKDFCPVVNGNFSILAGEGRCTLGWFKKDDVELIEAKPTKWTPKIGDIVRINSPGQINHGKVGIVVVKKARRYGVTSEVSGKWKAWGLTANELEFKGSQK